MIGKRVVVIALAALLGSSASAFEGAWTATRDDDERGRLHLNLTRGRTNNISVTLSIAELAGLAPDAIDAVEREPVRFELRREAGVTRFDGTFRAGRGSGEFTFTPRPAFLEEVRALGVDAAARGDGDERLFGLALVGVSLDYIRSMIAEGYRVGLDDYMSLRIFDVTPAYVREMRALGFRRITHDELVATKIHGVTPEYVRRMRARGWDLSLDDYQQNRIFDVTPELAEEMRQLGFEGLTRDELVGFRIHGVTREFVHAMREAGYGELTADELLSARIHGVTPEFIAELERAGYTGVPFDKLLALRMSGLPPAVLERLRAY